MQKKLGKLIVVALIAGLAGALSATWLNRGHPVTAQPRVEDSISARLFALVDDTGSTRGILSLQSNGQPALQLLDQSSRQRAAVYLDRQGRPSFSVLDEAERERASVFIDQRGEANVAVLDTNGKYRAGMFFTQDGRPFITLEDGNHLQAGMYLASDNMPRIALTDRQGELRQSLGVFSDGTGFQAFVDQNGRVISWDPKGSALLGPLR